MGAIIFPFFMESSYLWLRSLNKDWNFPNLGVFNSNCFGGFYYFDRLGAVEAVPSFLPRHRTSVVAVTAVAGCSDGLQQSRVSAAATAACFTRHFGLVAVLGGLLLHPSYSCFCFACCDCFSNYYCFSRLPYR